MATLGIDPEGLRRLRDNNPGIDTDKILAARIGIDGGSMSRVLAGNQAPGPRFIAGVVKAFGKHWFSELFVVLEDGKRPIEPSQ